MVHIDTDVQEEEGFGVPRREGGTELTIPECVSRVIDRLRKDIDASWYKENAHRILFAIAADSIECWLLPLLYSNNKAEKTTGCLEAANYELRRTNRNGLGGGDGTKFPPAYEKASRDYRKRKTLDKHRERNLSLTLFLEQLDALHGRLNAHQPASPGEDGNAVPEGEKPPDNPSGDQAG